MYCYHWYHSYAQSHYRLEVPREVGTKPDHLPLGFEKLLARMDMCTHINPFSFLDVNSWIGG